MLCRRCNQSGWRRKSSKICRWFSSSSEMLQAPQSSGSVLFRTTKLWSTL
ncbi:hypothetical protein BDA96_01G042700 [Sorghum bicolor]|uniref:Uncharacterized protein n=2 Tax=Sorghum bicolor TaxID=4558 RepID=A0A921RV53_SORBI|nr:hypothetical protein BDA96_01G042700 [Sorghum bicolor]OQU90762.1 hypothetical protein SORBI_3001G041450 [Sorghum bicolor]